MKIINNLPIKTDIQKQIGNLSDLKTVLKNNLVSAVNWLYQSIMDKIGSADISGTGDGTITGAIMSLDSISKTLNTAATQEVANNDTTSVSGYVADARIVKIHGDEIDALKTANSSLSTTLSSHYYDKNQIDSLLTDTGSWKPWLPGHCIHGWGFVIIIPWRTRARTMAVNEIRAFTKAGWSVNLTLDYAQRYPGWFLIVCGMTPEMVIGETYIAELYLSIT